MRNVSMAAIAAAIAILTGGVPAIAQTNLLLNAGFETQGDGTDGGALDVGDEGDSAKWFQLNSGMRTNVIARSGEWSHKMPAHAIASGFVNNGQLIDFGRDVGGESFTFTAWALHLSTAPLGPFAQQSARMKYELFDVSGTFINSGGNNYLSGDCGNGTVCAPDVWHQGIVSFTAEPGTTKINIQFGNNHKAGDETFPYGDVYFDDFVFTRNTPGDYNNNGTVDAADYVLWRKGGPLQNEVDTPGTVDDADYTEWRARFGNTAAGSGSSLAAVPEPSGAVLVAVGLLAIAAGQRSRRRPMSS